MRITRRRLLFGGAAAGTAGVGAVVGLTAGGGGTEHAAAALPPPVTREPRQHAWDAALRRDEHGNALPPRFQRLVLCDLAADATPDRARAAEAALRRVEHAVPATPAGVLMTVGWGPSWFRTVGVDAPIPAPKALSSVEAPTLDDPIAIVHLASDDEGLLNRVERALFAGGSLPGAGGPVSLTGLLRVKTRRTGFVGAGLPRANQHDVVGLPTDRPIARSAPLYMGFQSGLKKNQATEDDVTIAEGRWAGGTTMHASAIDLTLDTWYHGVDDAGRVRRMFGAERTPKDVAAHPTGLPNPDRDLAAVARTRGVVGHAEAMSSVRRNDRPLIIRRDFDSRDGDAAQVHFVALQRTIADFEKTRTAMNAAKAIDEQAGVGAQINNGINEWLTVTARGNYLVPPRPDRVCPGLQGWRA